MDIAGSFLLFQVIKRRALCALVNSIGWLVKAVLLTSNLKRPSESPISRSSVSMADSWAIVVFLAGGQGEGNSVTMPMVPSFIFDSIMRSLANRH